ncbi:hypothetical protein N7535_006984, partial [Penicillium sp. DV-2018c]
TFPTRNIFFLRLPNPSTFLQPCRPHPRAGSPKEQTLAHSSPSVTLLLRGGRSLRCSMSVTFRLALVNRHTSEEMHRRHGHYSYAMAKLLCCDPKKPSRKAFMRVYLKVFF